MLKYKFFWTAGIIFRIINIAELTEVISFVDFKYSLLESTWFLFIVLCIFAFIFTLKLDSYLT